MKLANCTLGSEVRAGMLAGLISVAADYLITRSQKHCSTELQDCSAWVRTRACD